MQSIVVGTQGALTIPIFSGSFRNATFEREAYIKKVECVRETYGARNKHWITFEIIESDEPEFPAGTRKRMQGKNAYRNLEITAQPADVEQLTRDKNEAKELNAINCQW